MNLVNLGPREMLRVLFSWKGLLTLALFLQLLLNLPARIEAYLPELPGLIADTRNWLSIVSYVSLGGALIQYAIYLIRRPKPEAPEIPDIDDILPVLEHLSNEERHVLAWYMEEDNNMRAQYLRYDDRGVKRLADVGIISQFSLSASDADGLPFLIKDWVLIHLKRHAELLR